MYILFKTNSNNKNYKKQSFFTENKWVALDLFNFLHIDTKGLTRFQSETLVHAIW